MIDTHSHIDAEEFDNDREDVINRAKNAGVEKILIPNVNPNSLPVVEKICGDNHGFLYPMIGLHPEDANPKDMDIDAFMDYMESRLQTTHPFVAIGEVGLDYYWDATYRHLQMEVFETQVKWAVKYNLPLMIHSREAHDDLIRILGNHYCDNLKGVFHCFTGDHRQAQEVLEFNNFMLGIGGVVTFKKATLPQVLADCVPLSRIVLETDAPYLAPVPYRGKRNEPSFLPSVINKLAEVYRCNAATVETSTTRNANLVFTNISN
jgi:TatD DNase family protein